jgi:hypothetical protein
MFLVTAGYFGFLAFGGAQAIDSLLHTVFGS